MGNKMNGKTAGFTAPKNSVFPDHNKRRPLCKMSQPVTFVPSFLPQDLQLEFDVAAGQLKPVALPEASEATSILAQMGQGRFGLLLEGSWYRFDISSPGLEDVLRQNHLCIRSIHNFMVVFCRVLRRFAACRARWAEESASPPPSSQGSAG